MLFDLKAGRRSGAHACQYAEYETPSGRVSIPQPGATLHFGRRGTYQATALHELAHWIVPQDREHGAQFCATLVRLYAAMLGPRASALLNAALERHREN